MRCTGILTAAGQGRRFGAGDVSKQWLELAGKPLLLYGVTALLQAGCERILLTHAASDREHAETFLRDWKLTDDVIPVPGGDKRQQSIQNALDLIENDRLVAVHDGVRPLVGPVVIRRLLQLAEHADGAVPARRVTDTTKRVEAEEVVATLDRSRLIAVHTPQVFPALVLKRAYRAAARDGFLGTDDASLVERLEGARLLWLEDNAPALKITTPDDLAYAEYLIKEKQIADWMRL